MPSTSQHDTSFSETVFSYGGHVPAGDARKWSTVDKRPLWDFKNEFSHESSKLAIDYSNIEGSFRDRSAYVGRSGIRPDNRFKLNHAGDALNHYKDGGGMSDVWCMASAGCQFKAIRSPESRRETSETALPETVPTGMSHSERRRAVEKELEYGKHNKLVANVTC